MRVFDPRLPNHLHRSGTFNGNLMTMAAGCVALDLLTQDENKRLNALGERLADGLRQMFAETEDLGAVVTSYGSLVYINFETEGEVRTYSDLNLDSPVMAAFHLAALDEGVYLAPRCLPDHSGSLNPD